MLNIHDWVLLIQRGLNLLEGFVRLESVSCVSCELQNERMQRNAARELRAGCIIFCDIFISNPQPLSNCTMAHVSCELQNERMQRNAARELRAGCIIFCDIFISNPQPLSNCTMAHLFVWLIFGPK